VHASAARILLDLISSLAHGDGRVTEQELSLLHDRATRLLPEEEIESYFEACEDKEDAKLRFAAVLAEVQKLSPVRRLEMLLHCYDFAAVDGIVDEELEMLERARRILELSPQDAAMCRFAVEPTAARPRVEPGMAPSAVFVAHVGSELPDGLPLAAGVVMTAVALGSRRYIRVVDFEEAVLLDDEPILLSSLVELTPASRLSVVPYFFDVDDIMGLLDAARHGWKALEDRELPASVLVWRRGHLVALAALDETLAINGRQVPKCRRCVATARDRIRLRGVPFVPSFDLGGFPRPESVSIASVPSPRIPREARYHADADAGADADTAPAAHAPIDGLELTGVSLSTKSGLGLLDRVSFESRRSNLVAVMGPSGCGKTTLLDVLAANMRPEQGTVEACVGDRSFDVANLSERIALVPQDGLVEGSLSVRENVEIAARIRLPQADPRERAATAIARVGLFSRRDTRVGSPARRILSGGQRRRVAIAMELVGNPDVLLLDEPMSGLSSQDARNMALLFQDLARRGKLVVVVVHQPSVELFSCFDQVIVMDDGGRVAFVGTPADAIDYFSAHCSRLRWSKQSKQSGHQARHPDVILAALEQSTPRAEELPGGPRPRAYPAYYWQHMWNLRRQQRPPRSVPPVRPGRARACSSSMGDHITRFMAVLRRYAIVRARNRLALTMSLVVPPMLGLLLGLVMRKPYDDHGYSFHFNGNIGYFLFLFAIAGFFLGMASNCTAFIKERRSIQHERRLGVGVVHPVVARFLVSLLVATVETALLLAAGAYLLEIPGLIPTTFALGLAMNCVGVGVGLLVSAAASSTLTAQACVPLAIIPQLLLGGLVDYERMNPAIYLRSAGEPRAEQRDAPELARLMPVRWAYEGLMVAFAEDNPCEDRRRHDADPQPPEATRIASPSAGPPSIQIPDPEFREAILARMETRGAQVDSSRELFYELLERCPVRGAQAELERWANEGVCGCENTTIEGRVRNARDAREQLMAEGRHHDNVFLAPQRTVLGVAIEAPLVSFFVLFGMLLVSLGTTVIVLPRRK
jgi:ABC-type multidrug transport system ATPase subunit